MKRNFVVVSLLTLALLVAACATTTTPTTPDLSGTVTAIDANSITVKAAAGDSKTVTVSRGTKVSWYNGIDATERDVVVGHHVNVWLGEGSQNATKLVIAK